MIRIEERPSRKVAGSSSLFVSCPYDQRTLNCIKSCDVRFWHKDSKEWEVPLLSLSSLIDMLVYYDDVSFKAMDRPGESTGRKPVLEYRTKPYGYQMDGIEYGLNHAKWLLLDAPGLGKSLQMICLAEELREQEGIEGSTRASSAAWSASASAPAAGGIGPRWPRGPRNSPSP